MKKTLTIIILCLTFLIIYLLQINLFSWFTIAGVRPNLFIIFSLFIGLYSGRKSGLVMGASFGLIIDILGNSVIGQTAFALGTIGLLRRIFRQKLI